MEIEIGIPEQQREAIADELSKLLADTYTLYLKTHNFHWNVTGPHFQTLHELFEVQYTELAAAVDEIAERIRILGFPAPGSFKQFAKLSSIEESTEVPDADEMVRQLVVGHETVTRTARQAIDTVDEAADEVSMDLLVERMTVHEKNAWMLRSMLA